MRRVVIDNREILYSKEDQYIKVLLNDEDKERFEVDDNFTFFTVNTYIEQNYINNPTFQGLIQEVFNSNDYQRKIGWSIDEKINFLTILLPGRRTRNVYL